jgi:hypothetical protein
MQEVYSPGKRLERYTIARPQEVLLVTIEIEGVSDTIAIYKGFSSSLVRGTNFDPDIPLITDAAKIIAIDRVKAPYQANEPKYIQAELSWETMQTILLELTI